MSLLIKFVIQSETSTEKEKEKKKKDNEPQDVKCKWCNNKRELMYDDIRVMIWRLGHDRSME